ncbi:protein FAM241B isoform X4 [Vicugna pacos]|uniref:Protein FAM241B isoform X4 n=1 Tax=Vicugna pacos TaxID=30538 RepID=A0ABM5E2V6_VICPA
MLPLPGASPQAALTPPAPTPPTCFIFCANPLFLSWLIPALLLFLLLLWHICCLCHKKVCDSCPHSLCPALINPLRDQSRVCSMTLPVGRFPSAPSSQPANKAQTLPFIWDRHNLGFQTTKEPPPTQERAKEPEDTCHMQTCPTVIVPHGCQGCRMKRMEGKLDTLCDFVQRYSQAPLMWCPPRAMGRHINFTLMEHYCAHMLFSTDTCLPPS